jgi:hypothetical protein
MGNLCNQNSAGLAIWTETCLAGILRFPVGKNRLKADVLPKASHVFQQPMGFIWLDWKKRREGGFPGFGRGSWAAKYEP